MKREQAIIAAAALGAVAALGCSKSAQVSEQKARAHAETLAKLAEEDVAEVRRGLPEGAKALAALYRGDTKPADDLKGVRVALEQARAKVQDLRVAKSTFFALAAPDGGVLRNDQEQDLMTGKNFFTAFPKLKDALGGKYVETRGSMPEAAAVRRADAQWVAAEPVEVDGKVEGLYVTGWSWSAYAYRLENALRSEVRGALGKNENLPLVYVYVIADRAAYGAPVSPEVSAKAILAQDPLAHLSGGVFSTQLEITGRDFGLAVKPLAAFGDGVAVAVLRSET